MYFEFVILIFDYFKTIDKKIIIYEWILPFLIGIIVFIFLEESAIESVLSTFRNNSIRLLGILVGFSITIITILTTSDNKNLNEIKNQLTEVSINNKKISLYKLLIINFTYSVIMEVLLIIFSLIYPLVLNEKVTALLAVKIIFVIYAILILHILLLTIRNMSNFYLIISSNKNDCI